MSFGGGNVGEVIEDGGEARHAKGDANVGADATCQRPEKSRENAPELISYIFQGLRLGVIASLNIDLLTSLSTLRKTLSFYLLQKMVSHFI